MSRIPRTKSRPITVDNVKYRWMIKNAKWRYGGSSKTMRLVIQNEADRPGDPALVELVSKLWNEGHAQEWDFTHNAALMPGDVAIIIRTALTQGWKPEKQSGHPFRPVGPLDLAEYQIRVPELPPPLLKNWWDFLMEAE
jgi:hypothetical protein